MRPGISFSASSISLRPKSASERSATLKSGAPAPAGVAESVVVVIGTPCVVGRARARTGFQGVGPDHWMTAADGPTGVHSTPAAPTTSRAEWAPTESESDALAQRVLELEDRVDRPGIDVVVEREVAARPVAHVHQVEELSEPPLALGAHLEHLREGLFDQRARECEPSPELLVLEVVPQLHEREDLTRHVAVLAPPADLVVVELGVGIPERRRLCVLVHVALPALRGDGPEGAAAVEDRDRRPDPPRDLARWIGGRVDVSAALLAPGRELAPRRVEPLPRAGKEAHPLEHHEQRRQERADRGAREVPGRTGHVYRAPLPRQGFQLSASTDGDEARARVERAGGHPQGLVGVARVRDCESERARSDETRRADLLEHDHGYGERRIGDGGEHVAGDPRTAHAEHDDVVDVGRRRKVDRIERLSRAPMGLGELLGESADRVEKPHRVRHALGLERRLDPLGLRLAHQPAVLGVVDGLRLVDQHDRDVVAHGVAALEARVVQRALVLEIEERALVLGTGEDLEQLGVQSHYISFGLARQRAPWRAGGRRYSPRTSASTSAVCASQPAASRASRLSRSNGSVLLGRRLNHQSPRSTVSPSSRSCCAPRYASATRSMTAAGSSTLVLISPESAYRSNGRRSSDSGSSARDSCSSTTIEAMRPESARKLSRK